GSNSGSEAEFEAMVLQVLEDVAEKGIAKERLDAVLHQLELSQREISGDGYPYGLQLILGALSPMLHGGDPVALLDLEPVLVKLRERVEDPDYIKQLVRKLLIDNPHRVTLTLKPDQNYEAQRSAAVKAELARKRAELSDEDKQRIVEQAKLLKARQESKDDESILPKVGIEDVPLHLVTPEGEKADVGEYISCYKQGTNGLVYQQIIVDMPELTEAQRQLLPIYTGTLTELGVGDCDYLEIQNQQSAYTGGMSVFTTVKGGVNDEQDIRAVLVVSGKALVRNHQKLTELMHDMLDNARFDELERFQELVAQMRARREQAVTNNGHGLAMGVAASGMSPAAKLSYELGGMQGIVALKALDDRLQQTEALQALANELAALHSLIKSAPRQYLVIAESEQMQGVVDVINQRHQQFAAQQHKPFALPAIRESVREAWLTSTQVSFCAKAYPTVPVGHADAPALTVLGGFLRNGYLHRAIREQGGAYGGGASQDSLSACFRFFSYRDPRLADTLNDFDASLQWLLKHEHDAEQLEQAILGVISQIDKPRSPAGEAKSDFHNLLFGRSKEQREKFRQDILAVTLDDLRRVVETYLNPEQASIGVITSSANREVLRNLGLEIKEL
ncbi:MAG: peptidase M16, partial [Oleiphilaceae bacterium]|nr:peptidase M16 [Oleiphilaceae bacterium]